MKLTAENVRAVVMDSLPKTVTPEEEKDLLSWKNPPGFVLAQGVVSKFAFRKNNLEAHREDVASLLRCLPDEFHKDKGGGWSFLNGCMDKDGVQWGEQRDVDTLICLGLALGLVSFPMPRDMWSVLPGGVPYFVVDAPEVCPSI